jgi:enoyl-CoA hydratase
MSLTTIRFEKKEKIGIIRLNRPHRMNAVNESMYGEIQKVLTDTESDNAVRVLILTGSVYKKDNRMKQAFCAGADLKEHSSGRRSKNQQRVYIELAHETTRRIYEYPKPTIAAVNGPARGAGVEMALNCDFLLMAHTATVALTETGLGTFVGGGITAHLPAIVGLMRAKDLIYTGKVLTGKEAVKMGLALASVPVDDLMDCTLDLARTISEKAPISLGYAKKRLQDTGATDLRAVLKNETEAILSCMETEDWREGIRSFIEKRKPQYKGK